MDSVLMPSDFSNRPRYFTPLVIKRLIYIILFKKSLQISLLPIKQCVISVGSHTLQSQVLGLSERCFH